MDNSTRQLVEFALKTSYEALDEPVIHECKRRLIDTFACAIGAFNDPFCVGIRALAAQYAGPHGATLWGTTVRTNSEMAAFANGVMLRIHDFNDTFFAREGGHPSDIIAGVVAAAEYARADGRALIEATVVGYEVYCRMMDAVDVGARGFDQPVYGLVATALAVGKLMGLSQDQLGHAVSLALTPNVALRQTRKGQLSNWKGCATANASRNALFAAKLASLGVTGPSDIFEGEQGLWSAVGRFDLAPAAHWHPPRKVGATYLKYFAVCYHAEAAAQAALALHPRIGRREIASIEVETYDEAVRMIGSDPGRWAPRNRETADHSLPFIVATCLVNGEVSADSFDESRLADLDVGALMRKVKVTESPALTALYPEAAPARLTVRMACGEALQAEVRYPKGHSGDPMSDNEVEAKFSALWKSAGRQGNGDEILSVLWRIDSAADIGEQILPGLAACFVP